MKLKRVILMTVAIVTAVSASLLLFAVLLAATQPVPNPHSALIEKEKNIINSPQDTQAISVVFPEGNWPWYAQEEISVHPEPPIPGHPTELCAEVINLDPANAHIVNLEFRVANFGIGVPFSPVGQVELEVPPGGSAHGCIVWIPPDPGHWCIEVLLTEPGEPEIQRSQRNIDIWEPLVPGQEDSLPFPVGPFSEETTITFTTKNAAEGWSVVVEPESLTLPPAQQGEAALLVTPPDGEPLGSRQVIADVEGFVNGELIGGFRKFDWPPVPLHRPKDPFFAESEISVHPYPPRAGEPTEICVELYNVSDQPQIVELDFNWANFGIGLPFQPIGEPITVEIPPHGHETICTWWVPPFDGHFCIQVRLDIIGNIEYQPQFSQRNLDVAEPLEPGVPHITEFPVGNFFNEFTNPDPVPTDIWLETDIHLPDWQVELIPTVLQNMLPDEERMVTMIVTPPLELPHDGMPIVDIRAFVDDTPGPRLIGGFRKIFRPPVPLHRFPDPTYAEREITVQPYPPVAGEPTEICVELYNPTPLPQTAVVNFSWANFGIGIPFTPINGPRVVHLPPFSTVKECIHWIPPVSGHVCLQVELEMDGYHPQWSQLNLDVDEPLQPNEPHAREFPVGNPFPYPVDIELGLISHLPDWGLELSQDVLLDMAPGEVRPVILTVTPPNDLPPDGQPIVDVEAYVEGELIGGFRKIFRLPVPIHRPEDPIYAESEIFIHPYPPRAQEPTEIGAEIRNPTDEPQTVTVTFSFANFGIGLPFTPINDPIVVDIPPHSVIYPSTMWLPPHEGLWCVQVEIELPGQDEILYSQRNMDVGEPLEPNTPHSRPFPVGNPFNYPVTITLGMIPHFPDWGLELSQDVLPNMGPGEVRDVILTVTPPNDLPADGDPIVDVEAFAEGELIGGFRKIFRPPVPVHRPQDPVYAESEIGVDPYPVIPGQPVELSVEVFNPTDQDHIVTATFSVANFGIGLPFSTAHITPNPIQIFVPANGAARGHVLWQPPDWQGKFCVRVELQMEGHEMVWSQRNIDVGEPLEPGQPHSLIFPVGNWPYTEPVTVNLGLIGQMPNWDFALSQDVLTNVTADQPISVTLTVTPPLDISLGTGAPIVDVEAYVEGTLLGGFRKMDIPPIPLHKPHEKGYAESEISIQPYPPHQGEEVTVSTVVQNNGEDPVTVDLEFGWAKFGMGIPFTNTGMTPYTRSVTINPAMTETATVSWIPTLAGSQCVIIRLNADGYEPQESQRNVHVEDRPPCGLTKVFTFTVYNDSPFTATVDIGLITFNVPADWTVTTIPSDTLELGPFSDGVITVMVTIPCPPTMQASRAVQEVYALQAAAGSTPIVDVEGYINGRLVGGIEIQFEGDGQQTLYLPVIMR